MWEGSNRIGNLEGMEFLVTVGVPMLKKESVTQFFIDFWGTRKHLVFVLPDKFSEKFLQNQNPFYLIRVEWVGEGDLLRLFGPVFCIFGDFLFVIVHITSSSGFKLSGDLVTTTIRKKGKLEETGLDFGRTSDLHSQSCLSWPRLREIKANFSPFRQKIVSPFHTFSGHKENKRTKRRQRKKKKNSQGRGFVTKTFSVVDLERWY